MTAQREPQNPPLDRRSAPVGRFGWLLYRLGLKGLPGVWRLSGYARRGLDVDVICPRCYAAWEAGDWFWRFCRACRRKATCNHDWHYLERRQGETWTGYCQQCSKCGEIVQVPQ